MKISNKPTWSDINKPQFPKLMADLEAEVVVIGGGLAGVLISYLLGKAGKEVVLLEAEEIGSGTTEYTTAFLSQIIDTSISDLIEMFGEENAKLIWDSHAVAIDALESIVSSEQIECEFTRCSAFIYSNDEKETVELKKDQRAAKKIGFNLNSLPSNALKFKNLAAIEMIEQAKFHPLKFLEALAKKTAENGVIIHTNSEVLDIDYENLVVKTKKNKIKAEQIVIATYYPFQNPKETHYKKGTYKSYLIEAQIPKGILREGLYWDYDSPYHYFRVDPKPGFDQLLLGGQDHRKELKISETKNFRMLREYLQEIMANLNFEITRQWSGMVLEPSDGLALIGSLDNPNILVSTAFSGNGMTYSMIAAMMIHDLVLKRSNPWIELYDPVRKPSVHQLMVKAKDYFAELRGGAVKTIFHK